VHSLEKGEVSVGGEDGETSADYNAGLPVVAFRFSDEFKREFPHIKQENISNLLRAKQYIIPNYPLPPSTDKIEILRVVVRESMSFDLLDRLISDICVTTQNLIVRSLSPLPPFFSLPLLPYRYSHCMRRLINHIGFRHSRPHHPSARQKQHYGRERTRYARHATF